jgi:protein O-mannosyl-transferase
MKKNKKQIQKARQQPAPKQAGCLLPTPSLFDIPANYVLLFGAVCIIIYWSTLGADFLTWDDDLNITINSTILNRDFIEAWIRPHYGYYMPLTASAWILLSGSGPPLNPLPYHLANLLLHFVNSLLVFDLLRLLLTRLGKKDEGSAIAPAALTGALLFCLHPLQVEPVCWATGLRDVLSATFALAACLWYVRSSSLKQYAVSVACFLCALLCKPSVVALPLGLLVLNRYFSSVRLIDDMKRLGLFVLAALPIMAITKIQEADWKFTHYIPPVHLRPLVLLDALGFYVEKFFWPLNLAANYSRTTEQALSSTALYGTIPVVFFFCLAVALLSRRISRGIAGGVLFGTAFLLPVSGIIPFAYQAISTVADRYMYLPLVGLCCAVSCIFFRLRQRPLQVLLFLFLGFLLTLAALRAPIWKNDTAFYTAWVHDNPENDRGYIGLGVVAEEEGRFQDAENYFRKAMSIYPLNPVTIAKLSFILLQQNRPADVVSLIFPALNSTAFMEKNRTKFSPMAMVYFAAGLAQGQTGDLKNSYLSFCQSLRLFPGNLDADQKLKAVKAALEARGEMVEPCPQDVPDAAAGKP